jgi:diguanylate cyclase (GGDEF)-like protein
LKNSHEWKKYSDEIQQTVNKSGIQWMLVLVIFFQVIITIYLNIDNQQIKHSSVLPFILIALSFVISVLYLWANNAIFINFFSCSIMLTITWLSMAFIIYNQWGAIESAQSLLIIAFICSLLANYSNLFLLFVSSFTLTTAYIVLQLQVATHLTEFDLFITFSKFPVLLILFMQTIRKMLLKGQHSVVQNEILNRQLQRLSITDDLTQIQNRKGFRLALASSLASAQRFKLGFTLLILDIDFFKQYNDSLGHPAGDKCLVNIAEILTGCFQRETDIVTRLGGEEFAVLVPDVDWHAADKICQRIHQALAEAAIVHPNSPVSSAVTVCIGGAIFTTDDDDSSIYVRADKALYQAKSQGRNCSVISANESQENSVES